MKINITKTTKTKQQFTFCVFMKADNCSLSTCMTFIVFIIYSMLELGIVY